MKEILDRLEAEIDNFRAALEWSGDSTERAESCLRLLCAIGNFMARRISITEGNEQLSRATASPEGVNPSLRAKGLYLLGSRATTFQNFANARRLLEESLEIRQALDERLGIAATLNALGTLATYQKDYASALRRYEESLLIQRELGNRKGIAAALNNLGSSAFYRGDTAAAVSYYEEALQIKREDGDPMGTYIALLNFGEMNLSVKNYDVAGAMLRECLDIVVEYNLIGSITWALEAVGGFLATTNSLLNAARVWGAAERRREKSSEPLPIQDREKLDGQISAARGALADDAAFDAAWQEGRTMTLEQAVALAQTGSAEKRASE